LFCPNCGTKNQDTATTCTKCGFNVKGAAAPKFKGTMLMMNQNVAALKAQAAAQAAAPAAPQAAHPSAPPPPGAPAPAPLGPPTPAKPQFKGTMVGVAPPGGFRAPAQTPAPAAAPPASAPPGGAPQPAPAQPTPLGFAPTALGMAVPQQAGGYAPPAQPAGFGTPGPAPGADAAVNPLGGTIALGQMPAPPPGAPAPGAPQAQTPPPWAAGPAAAPGFPPPGGQTPPGQFPGAAAPPQAGPPMGYGAPAMGAPGAYGPPPAAMVPAPAAAPAGFAAPFAVRGKVRNPFVVLALSCVTCGIYGMIWAYQSLAELKAYLNKDEIVPWHIFVPVLNLVVMLFKLPDWVTEAKQRAGARNPKSAGALLYFFLAWYFLTVDLNEIWQAGPPAPAAWPGAQQPPAPPWQAGPPPNPYQGGAPPAG
jgi:hypothetical protein